MQTFTSLTGVAAPLPMANVDTDKILAGRFLKTISRTGLGDKLFHSMRYDEAGAERPDFVLNRPPWRQAAILIALDNFGCGSSREHAPWALADFGIRCIIAPSFADIFYNNCFKNGILPVVLDRSTVNGLMQRAQHAETAELAVDLPRQDITCSDGAVIGFEIAPERKEALLYGLDEIATTLTHLADIERWEEGRADTLLPIRQDLLLR